MSRMRLTPAVRISLELVLFTMTLLICEGAKVHDKPRKVVCVCQCGSVAN